ncbi:MAG: hypothetical protein DWG83_00445 [Chloroflexi bacterium]|nr:hypothetical protein [Chloroflexota bacterium]MDA1239906.1 hypothetical protein [Chloroflexota bacterium]MQC19028.1 hypothetical protein [Chloroflexota bacterium]
MATRITEAEFAAAVDAILDRVQYEREVFELMRGDELMGVLRPIEQSPVLDAPQATEGEESPTAPSDRSR